MYPSLLSLGSYASLVLSVSLDLTIPDFFWVTAGCAASSKWAEAGSAAEHPTRTALAPKNRSIILRLKTPSRMKVGAASSLM